MEKRFIVPLPPEILGAIASQGKRITKARRRLKLSHSQLADACGLTRNTIVGIEAGAVSAAIGNVYMVLWKLAQLEAAALAAGALPEEDGPE